MKKTIISFSIIAACIMAFLTMTSFNTISSASASKALAFDRGEPITIFATTTSSEGSTYYGPVTLSGAINATGTYVMPTEVNGMALHCMFVLTLPAGTITIRMNCNMVTFNGVWKILDGTGAYQNLKGGGKLIMPNDTDEILTGTVRGL